MSGLDPIGRKEFRDILLERARAGAAVMFSSHILPDVEMIAERVAIINEGVVADQGPLAALLERDTTGVEVGASGLSAEAAEGLAKGARSHEHRAGVDRFVAVSESAAAELAKNIVAAGGHLLEIVPHRGTLEDVLLRVAKRKDNSAA
jgi:ABC-2 type transport system ATP-binding protein